MKEWLGRLGAALFVAAIGGFAALAPDMHLLGLTQPQLDLVKRAQAQAGQQPGCPLQLAPRIISASSYKLSSADRCDLVVLTATGQITVQLPAPGLIFSPGWSASVLPINGGQVTLTGLPDQAGVTHKVNLNNSLLLSAGSGASLRVLQDSNWWAEARFSAFNPDAVAHNVLKIYPPAGTDTLNGLTPWTIITPDQSTVSMGNGTCSSGFNEAEAAAYLKGWPIEVHGDGEFQGSASIHHSMWNSCSGGFVLKPLANRYAAFYSLQMQCIGGANKGCLNVDSMMKGALIMKGAEIVVAPTTASTATCGALFAAQTALPSENQIVITDSEIEIGNVAIQPGSGTARAAVCFNVFAGGIVANRKIKITEANGGGANNLAKAFADISVFGADTGVGSFAANIVEVGHPHSAQTAAILIGENTTNASRYGGNIWQVGFCDPSYSGSQCIATFGSGDDFTVGTTNSASGPYQYMAYAQEGAQNNTFRFLTSSGASGASGLNPGFADFSGAGAVAQWLNNYHANGKPFSVLGDDGQPLSGLAPSSVTNGTVGATSTITKGRYTADGSSPTGFSVNLPFTRNAVYRGCNGSSNVASANPVRLSSPASTTQVSFTAAAAMAAGTQVYYNCW